MADERPIVGSKNEYIEACFRVAKDPLALTARDFAVLESTHPDVAQEGRRKQAQARAKAAEAAVVAQQKAMNEQAASLATTARVRLTPYKDGDDFDAWLTTNAWAPAPIWMIQDLREFAKQTGEKNKERNAKIEALEARCAALEARSVGVKYCGTWQAHTIYDMHAAVTHHGSLWICKAHRASSEPGEDAQGWQLCVKRGRDGKDGKDLR